MICRFFTTLMLGLLIGCSPPTNKSGSARTSSAQSKQVFQVKGVIKELNTGGKTVTVRHEEVPNYMPAMSMPFTAKNPHELTGLKAGDQVEFRMTVADNDVWIDQIRKVEPSAASANGQTA